MTVTLDWTQTDWQTHHAAVALANGQNLRRVRDTARGRYVLEAVNPAAQQFGFGYQADFAKNGVGVRDDVSFTYDVWFPKDYPWMNSKGGGGGKLPGLAGRVASTNPIHVGHGGIRWNGDQQITRKADLPTMTGFSARLLWLKDRRLKCYLYVPDLGHLGAIYGTEGSTGWRCFGYSEQLAVGGTPLKLRDGWNTITERVRLNTVGKADGVLEISLNGVVGLTRMDIMWRTRPDVHVSQAYVTWFYGGASSDFPDRDGRIRLDRMRFA